MCDISGARAGSERARATAETRGHEDVDDGGEETRNAKSPGEARRGRGK